MVPPPVVPLLVELVLEVELVLVLLEEEVVVPPVPVPPPLPVVPALPPVPVLVPPPVPPVKVLPPVPLLVVVPLLAVVLPLPVEPVSAACWPPPQPPRADASTASARNERRARWWVMPRSECRGRTTAPALDFAECGAIGWIAARIAGIARRYVVVQKEMNHRGTEGDHLGSQAHPLHALIPSLSRPLRFAPLLRYCSRIVIDLP